MFKCMLLSQKTNVREVRRYARDVLHSMMMCPFNQAYVEAKRSTLENTKDKKKAKRVKGRQRVQMLSKYVSDLNSDIEEVTTDIHRDL